MPSTVLEIMKEGENEYSIRLHENTCQKEPYAALSYIWGKPQTYRLLMSNIDEFKNRINSKDLPLTIMDAVKCAHELGLRYLWVDGLCIIQDSQEDKAKEIGRKSSIYQNAHITISAAMAKSCDEGFLGTRELVENLPKMSFKLDILTPKDPVALNQWIEKYRTKDNFSNYVPMHHAIATFKTSDWNKLDSWFDTPSAV